MRVQWKARTPGWSTSDLPTGYVFVGRGRGEFGRWGNPFSVKEHGRDEAVRRHREWLLADPARIAEVRGHLAGRPLACWCPLDMPCHGDALLEVAAKEAGGRCTPDLPRNVTTPDRTAPDAPAAPPACRRISGAAIEKENRAT